MKIPGSVRNVYQDQRALNERLKRTVDTIVRGFKKPRWHYESRIKELSSFALKIESGRFENPCALEDFFACTIVVANAAEIAEAELLVSERFITKQRRPPRDDKTHKESYSFQFDDLRLYLALRQGEASPPSNLTNVLFELQIKTFLQHAWSIATHELLYKTDEVDWSKQRIAYQVKAMLEHAEISIQEASNLATSTTLAKEDDKTTAIKEALRLVKAQWVAEDLPSDVRRLAENVVTLLKALQLNTGRLEEILLQERGKRGGAHPSNLSPYATIIQYLFDVEGERVVTFLKSKEGKSRILVPIEIEIPAGTNRAECRKAIFL